MWGTGPSNPKDAPLFRDHQFRPSFPVVDAAAIERNEAISALLVEGWFSMVHIGDLPADHKRDGIWDV